MPPDHINTKLSAGVSEIIELCMAKDRDKRYSRASQLLEDVRAVQRGEPPAQARRKFDLSKLTELEETGVTHAVGSVQPQGLPPQPQFTQMLASPLGLIAAAGWLLVLVLILIAFIMAGAG